MAIDSTTGKIYILDDDESVRKALSRLMRSAGLKHETFASGEDFFAAVPETSQGCVIMDIRMPGMTGHDILEQLREKGSPLSVIFLSAQDDAETRAQARAYGAVAFFRKPVDDQALIDAIHWALSENKATKRK